MLIVPKSIEIHDTRSNAPKEPIDYFVAERGQADLDGQYYYSLAHAQITMIIEKNTNERVFYQLKCRLTSSAFNDPLLYDCKIDWLPGQERHNPSVSISYATLGKIKPEEKEILIEFLDGSKVIASRKAKLVFANPPNISVNLTETGVDVRY